MNTLDQLRVHSVVVADTGDLQALKRFGTQDATTNPSLVLKAFHSPHLSALLEQAALTERTNGTSAIVERLLVALGVEVLQVVPGRVSTEIDPRLSYDSAGSVAAARRIIERYAAARVPRARVLIKLAATWEGIQAARQLEQQGIRTNLTLVFCMAQARACADAGVRVVSPFVGRIYDWYRERAGAMWDDAAMGGPNDPGVRSVAEIYRHYKRYGVQTEVMAASFRNVGQIVALAGCDLMTISPALLAELAASESPVHRCLTPDSTIHSPPGVITEDRFRAALDADAMASEKLTQGIEQFVNDTVQLERLVQAYLD